MSPDPCQPPGACEQPDLRSAAEARPPDPRRALGRLGEHLAAAHLQRLGFAILARNVRTRYGEIDLIAFDGAVLAFVEVKTRRARTRKGQGCQATTEASDVRPGASLAAASPAGTPPPAAPPAHAHMALAPLDGLGRRQRARLRRLASAWLQARSPPLRAKELRFDAIGIVVDAHGHLLRLDHVEGAW